MRLSSSVEPKYVATMIPMFRTSFIRCLCDVFFSLDIYETASMYGIKWSARGRTGAGIHVFTIAPYVCIQRLCLPKPNLMKVSKKLPSAFSISENHFQLISKTPAQKQMSPNWPSFCLVAIISIIFQTTIPAQKAESKAAVSTKNSLVCFGTNLRPLHVRGEAGHPG
jgi:hypothetical protein